MNSHLLKIAKNLLVLTLIVGFFVMPFSPIFADEIVNDSSAVVVSTTNDISEVPPVITEDPIVSTPETNPVVPSEIVVTNSVASTSTEELTSEVVASSSPASSTDEVIETKSEEATTTVPVVENPIVTTGEPVSNDNLLEAENNFSTLAEGVIPTDPIAECDNSCPDNSATTSNSEEIDFLTLGDSDCPITQSAVSEEGTFVTSEAVITTTLAVSRERSFLTLACPVIDPVVSGELNFNTLPGGPSHEDPSVSEELSFITLSPTSDPTVSDEMSFTTLSGGGPIDNGENSFVTLGSGSSSGGGGGGGGYTIVTPEKPFVCELFLKKFIKYGANNDPREVAKLQAFLKVFEGFDNLKITGYYDLATYRAVEIFQKRYSRDVLNPWGISDSTGYVYITTTITINRIYCNRDTRNGLDLRNVFAREYEAAMGEPFEITKPDEGYTIATETEATSTETIVKKNWLIAGLGNLFDFIGDNLCWLLNLLLLLIIFFLLWLLWLAGRDKEEENGGEVDPIVNSDLGLVGAVALDELISHEDEQALSAIVAEEEDKAESLNNNPEQNVISL